MEVGECRISENFKIGIYMIRNKINNKVYIGQSVNIIKRWSVHKTYPFNKKNEKKNKRAYYSHLYNSIRKYGLENFEFIILEECSRDLLNEKELYYIKKFNSTDFNFGYNNTDIINDKSISSKLSNKKLYELIEDFKKFELNISQLAEKYNVSESTIKAINRGESLRLDNLEYPIRDNKLFREVNKKKNEIKNKTYKKCLICNKKFLKTSKPKKYCSTRCRSESQIKFKRPEEIDIFNLLNEGHSFDSLGKIYGVTGNTIRKLLSSSDSEVYQKAVLIVERNRFLKSKSKLKNVKLTESCSKPFLVSFYENGASVYYGRYATREEAAKIADERMVELYGEEVLTNKKLGLIDY